MNAPIAALTDRPQWTERLAVGAEVEVRSRFDDRWQPGFAVAAHEATGYRLRRASDASILPVVFEPASVRPSS